MSWSEQVRFFAELGYSVSETPPSPGSVISFDSAGKELRLRADCYTPAVFAGTIRARAIRVGTPDDRRPGGMTLPAPVVRGAAS
jgi:hypothetical protein